MKLSNVINSRNSAATLLSILLCLQLIFFHTNIYAQTSNTANSQQTNTKLDAIKAAITQQKKSLTDVNLKRKDLEEQLKRDDLAISHVATAIVNTNVNLNETKEKLAALKREELVLKKNKRKQEKILAKQIRAAYSTGHHDYLKLILNQEDPASVQRTITQYQYLNKARIKEIDKFKTTLAALLEVTLEVADKAKKLVMLTQQHHEQQQILELSKIKQKQTLNALNKKLLSGKQKLARLEDQEKNLVSLLKEMIKRAQKEEKLKGLSKLKKKLSWPVKGRILHSFGSRKQGHLKWKGVLLSAPIGQQVKTIHSGTILFSDWLKGYGLVTVVDHGEGYMSLYGHNQALLKTVGERVEAGEPIALSGQSGGQSKSGLYFEIRHTGIAVNPKKWCK